MLAVNYRIICGFICIGNNGFHNNVFLSSQIDLNFSCHYQKVLLISPKHPFGAEAITIRFIVTLIFFVHCLNRKLNKNIFFLSLSVSSLAKRTKPFLKKIFRGVKEVISTHIRKSYFLVLIKCGF